MLCYLDASISASRAIKLMGTVNCPIYSHTDSECVCVYQGSHRKALIDLKSMLHGELVKELYSIGNNPS